MSAIFASRGDATFSETLITSLVQAENKQTKTMTRSFRISEVAELFDSLFTLVIVVVFKPLFQSQSLKKKKKKTV